MVYRLKSEALEKQDEVIANSLVSGVTPLNVIFVNA